MDRAFLRKKIDKVDAKLVELFAKRMEIAGEIAKVKKAEGIPVLDSAREEQKLEEVAALSPDDLKEYTKRLYRTLFEVSRDYQDKIINKDEDR